ITGAFGYDGISRLLAGATAGGAEFVWGMNMCVFILCHGDLSCRGGSETTPLRNGLFYKPDPTELILQLPCLDAGQGVIQPLGDFSHLAAGQLQALILVA